MAPIKVAKIADTQIDKIIARGIENNSPHFASKNKA